MSFKSDLLKPPDVVMKRKLPFREKGAARFHVDRSVAWAAGIRTAVFTWTAHERVGVI